nr:cysteine-rich CWC family protein [Cohnella abietis]
MQANNANHCPLCGKGNNCGNLSGLPQGSCWCSKATFPPDIFKSVPPELINKTCICKSCLENFEIKKDK